MKLWKATTLGLGVLALGATGAYAYYRQAVDEPDFTLIRDDGAFQLRQYAPIVVAEVVHTGDRRSALNAGFRRLAAYIFAEDRPGEKIAMTSPVMQDQAEKIAMTAPVLQDAGDTTGSWRTRFLMPSGYSLATLPEPPSDIELSELPARRIAAVRFSGRGTTSDLDEREAQLRQWIAGQGLEIAGPAEFAFYDAPMVPPPLRRNEVMIPVK